MITRAFFNIQKKTAITLLIAFFAFGEMTAGLLIAPMEAKAALPPGFATETIAGGLNFPTSMAFTPDGRIFVGEKSGSIRVIKNGALLPTLLVQLTDINTYADRGLIGIAVDPNFATNKYIYLSYTYENTPGANLTAAKTARIVRMTVSGDTASEATKVVIVGTVGGSAATPSCKNYPAGTDCIASDSSSHSAGGLRFGPDGKLYATLGDGARFDVADPDALRAQNLDSLNGKMLRINTDGTAPIDNPFYNGNPNANRSKVYAYGVRNMFRFSFRPATGAIYGGDVGWDTWEEINIITPGGNYGWPCREGNNPTSYGCTATGHVNPVYTYVHDPGSGGSITAGVFPTGSVYPASYNNKMFFGDFAMNWMKFLEMSPTDTFVGTSDLMLSSDNPNGPVDYAVGPDGYIYFISIYTGDIRRFVYTLGNRQPIAQIAATPTSGSLPLSVSFSSAGSSDPDGNPLSYLWNFGNGTPTSSDANPVHEYTVAGTYIATLEVSDGLGGTNLKSITIFAGNRAPTPTISSPTNGALYFPGQVFTVSGSATDPENGTLSGASLTWRAILHHNTHTHVLQTASGNSFQFTAPDHGDPAVYTELELTATDSGGVTAKTSVNMYLNNGIAPGSNLVQNPSFETANPAFPNLPQSWNNYKWGTHTAAFAYPVAGQDGARAAQVTISGYVSGDSKWGHDPAYVAENTNYTFSDYYKSTTTTYLVAAVSFANDTMQYTQLATLPAAANWTQANATFQTPVGTRTLAIYHLINSNGSLTVDNYSLIGPGGTTPPVTGTNLVVNHSLENANTAGTLPLNWASNKWGTHTAAFAYPVAGQEGAKAAKITVSGYTSGDAKWFFNDVTVTPGTTYTFSDYYQSTAATRLVARFTTSANTISYLELGASLPINAGWSQATRSITIPAGVTKLTVFHVIAANGSLTVDNYFLSDGTTPPVGGTNLIANGFMENANAGNTAPLNWTPTTSGTGFTTTHTYPTTGQDGGKAARVVISGMPSGADGNARWQFDEVPIQTGTEYTYEGYYKGSTISDIIGRYTFADGSTHFFGLKKEIPAATNWTFVTGKFVGPVNVTSITLMHLISTNASLEIDNAKLYVSGTGTPNEIIPPTQSFTNPLDGQTVSGTITLTSDVQDNSGQAWIFYAVDGTPLGPEQPAPYSQQWDSTTVANGTHTLKVTSRDAVGNNNRQIITVNVNNTVTPPTGNNLILNPSLETANGALPQNWASNKWGTNTATFNYPVAGQEGAKAAEVQMTAYTSGDAKWIFNNVAVTPGNQYTFQNYYKATVPTQLVIRYTNGSGVASYVGFTSVPAAANWQTANMTFTPPAGTASVSVFHIISAVGTLTVDNYSLVGPGTPPPTDVCPNIAGNQATVPAGMVIDISGNCVTPPPSGGTNLVLNPSLETAAGSLPANWAHDFWGTHTRIFTYPVAGNDGAKAGKVEITGYTDGDAKWAFDHVTVTPGTTYTFSDHYQSNVPTTVIAEFKTASNVYSYQPIGGTVPASAAAWNTFTGNVTVPAGIQSMTIFHLLQSVGWLTIDQASVVAQ